MIPTVAEIKTRLKTLGYNATVDDDAFITFAISKVEERIKASINHDAVPNGLKYEFIDAVASNVMLSKLATGNVDADKIVQSIKEGDTTVSFDTSGDPLSILKSYLRGLDLSKTTLAHYRKFVW